MSDPTTVQATDSKNNYIEKFKFHYLLGINRKDDPNKPAVEYFHKFTSDELLKCVAERLVNNVSESQDKDKEENCPEISNLRFVAMSLKARVVIHSIDAALLHSDKELVQDDIQKHIDTLNENGNFDMFMKKALINI